jgi:DNA-binding NarL/FixJ family response regulator
MNSDKTVTILLADDHQVMREGLKALLSTEKDFTVVGESGDGLEAIRQAERLHPNVLVLDLKMPGLPGLEVLRQVKRVLPKVHVIILSMHANEAYVLEALTHGASGFVLKDSSVADLVRAVREAVAGRRYLSPPLTERAIQAYAEKARAGVREPFDELTAREREVLLLAAEGNTNAEIGRKLFISTRTVETHRANAMHKLNLHSHTALVRYVVERHLVPASDDDLSESTTESAS